jgi:hypothetical protein
LPCLGAHEAPTQRSWDGTIWPTRIADETTEVLKPVGTGRAHKGDMKRLAAALLVPTVVYFGACSSSSPGKAEGLCNGAGLCADGSVEAATVVADARGDGPVACASRFDCSSLSPLFAPSSDQNLVPCCMDNVCRLETFDGDCTDASAQIIQASNYDQSCATDTDCIGVAEGNFCYPGATNCPTATISKSANAQYQADVAKTRAASCYAPGSCGGDFGPCCVGGMCRVGSQCGNLVGDASADTGADAATDAAGECASNGIAFDLSVDATGPVYFGGPQPQWLDSFGCPSWLAIAPSGEPPLNLLKGGCGVGCPAFRPEPAMAQSFTWDGTYYPSDAGACQTPACAAPGNYVATLCVGYAGEDAGPETAPPTCKQVAFAWPPTSANQSIVESITPTPDGG